MIDSFWHVCVMVTVAACGYELVKYIGVTCLYYLLSFFTRSALHSFFFENAQIIDLSNWFVSSAAALRY